VAVAIADVQPVGLQRPAERHAPLKEAGGVQPLERHRRGAVVPAHLDLRGVGLGATRTTQIDCSLARANRGSRAASGFGIRAIDQRVIVTGGQFAALRPCRQFSTRRQEIGTSPIFPECNPATADQQSGK